MLPIIQIVLRAARGIGAVTMAVVGDWNSKTAGSIESSDRFVRLVAPEGRVSKSGMT
jgi:hypothetical protein